MLVQASYTDPQAPRHQPGACGAFSLTGAGLEDVTDSRHGSPCLHAAVPHEENFGPRGFVFSPACP